MDDGEHDGEFDRLGGMDCTLWEGGGPELLTDWTVKDGCLFGVLTEVFTSIRSGEYVKVYGDYN